MFPPLCSQGCLAARCYWREAAALHSLASAQPCPQPPPSTQLDTLESLHRRRRSFVNFQQYSNRFNKKLCPCTGFFFFFFCKQWLIFKKKKKKRVLCNRQRFHERVVKLFTANRFIHTMTGGYECSIRRHGDWKNCLSLHRIDCTTLHAL